MNEEYKKSVMAAAGLVNDSEFEEFEAIRYGEKPMPEWVHGRLHNKSVCLDIIADAIADYIRWKRNQSVE